MHHFISHIRSTRIPVEIQRPPIRIFVDAHLFDKEHQGARSFIREIYSCLLHKENLLLYFGAYDTGNLKSVFGEHDRIVYLKYSSRSPVLRLCYDIPRLIRKHHIDYAHFQYLALVYKNCRQIITLHDALFMDYPGEFPFLYSWLRKIFFRRSAHKADILTTASAYSKHSIENSFRLKEGKARIISNGVSPRFFERYDHAAAKEETRKKYGFEKIILYVSRIEPRKNHLLLIRSFLELKLYEKRYTLLMVGHPSLRVNKLEQLMQTLDPEVRKFIVFKKDVGDEELLQFYRSADVFVYPSIAEGFGIPPLEAAAARVPVLCSNTTAMKAYSFFGEDHVDPCDEKIFKNALLRMVERNRNETELSAVSHRVEQEYSWDRSAEELYQLIVQDSFIQSKAS
ncbi:MAG: glycosyltransferase family 4 protein [Flavisolibacter sp.]